MKRSIILLAIGAVLILATYALANRYEDLYVGDVHVGGTIYNQSGGSYAGTTAGDARYLQLSGGTMTGAPKQRSGRAAIFPNISTPGKLYGDVTGTVTGHASLDVPLTGATMTGPVKQRSGAAAVFPNISTPGSVTIGGHTFTTYTATVEGSVKHLLAY